MDDYCDQCGYRGKSLRAENASLQGKLDAVEANLKLFDRHLAKPHDHECGVSIVRTTRAILKEGE